jgi:signal transduction histidine kinase
VIRNSLTFRLFVTSVIWVSLTLAVVAVLLTVMFQRHVEEHFDAFLFDHLEENVAAGRVDEEGQFFMSWMPTDFRFNQPLSGWYWQVNKGRTVIATSSSLDGELLAFKLPASEKDRPVQKILGPKKERLRIAVVNVPLDDTGELYTFSIAGSASIIELDVEDFTTDLGITLIVLGIGLVSVIVIQIRFGLKPLRLLKTAMHDVRTGNRQRLPENFPVEVKATVHELNAMMDHSEALLKRARKQVGDLAHALKNPLSVIKNEANQIKGERGKILVDKAEAMGGHVERYLSRARAAGSGNIIGASVKVKEVAEDICFLMKRVYHDRPIEIELNALDDFYFKGDAQDLEEMLGNIMDNACKWAHSAVRVSGIKQGARLFLYVEDDGEGIPDEERLAVLKRGRRLDETVPGSGLGLSIVRDLANLYQGRLTLDQSLMGGLCVVLELPAAES